MRVPTFSFVKESLIAAVTTTTAVSTGLILFSLPASATCKEKCGSPPSGNQEQTQGQFQGQGQAIFNRIRLQQQQQFNPTINSFPTSTSNGGTGGSAKVINVVPSGNQGSGPATPATEVNTTTTQNTEAPLVPANAPGLPSWGNDPKIVFSFGNGECVAAVSMVGGKGISLGAWLGSFGFSNSPGSLPKKNDRNKVIYDLLDKFTLCGTIYQANKLAESLPQSDREFLIKTSIVQLLQKQDPSIAESLAKHFNVPLPVIAVPVPTTK